MTNRLLKTNVTVMNALFLELSVACEKSAEQVVDAMEKVYENVIMLEAKLRLRSHDGWRESFGRYFMNEPPRVKSVEEKNPLTIDVTKKKMFRNFKSGSKKLSEFFYIFCYARSRSRSLFVRRDQRTGKKMRRMIHSTDLFDSIC